MRMTRWRAVGAGAVMLALIAAGASGAAADRALGWFRAGDGRERATVVLSKPRAGAVSPAPVTIERRSTFGVVGDDVVGAAAYWDDYLFASLDHDRRQAWATPIRVATGDAGCGPLGLSFRFDAPGDQMSDIVALVAKPFRRAASNWWS